MYKLTNLNSCTCDVCSTRIEVPVFGIKKYPKNYHVDCFFSKIEANKRKINVKDFVCDPNIDERDKREFYSKLKIFLQRQLNKINMWLNTATAEEGNEQMNKASIKFETFIDLCQKVANLSKHFEKKNVIRNFVVVYQAENKDRYDLEILQKSLLDFYSLLMPSSIFHHSVFNLNYTKLFSIFSNLYNISIEQFNTDFVSSGLASNTIFNILHDSLHVKNGKLTCNHVVRLLNELSENHTENGLNEFFKKICKIMSILELKWLIRIILKDLNINAGEKIILSTLGQDAPRIFSQTHNLPDIIKWFLTNTKDVIQESAPKTAISPMLAKPLKCFEEIQKLIPNSNVCVEEKYDGERLQLHKSEDGEISFFTRQLNLVSPDKVFTILNSINEATRNASSLILDGELIMYSIENQRPLPFGLLGKNKKATLTNATACFVIFDCLHANGECLIKKPLLDRISCLKSCVTEQKNHVKIVEQKVYDKNTQIDHIKQDMNRIISLKGEGLIIKDPQGIYEPDKRRWLKLKLDHIKNHGINSISPDTYDLVLLGAFYGRGKFKQLINTFLLGCYDDEKGIWTTVTKAANGLSVQDLNDLQPTLCTILEKRKPKSKIEWLPGFESISKMSSMPLIVKNPNESIVFEIKGASSLTNSTEHTSSYSIRFPRIVCQRTDKSPKEATNLSFFKELNNTLT